MADNFFVRFFGDLQPGTRASRHKSLSAFLRGLKQIDPVFESWIEDRHFFKPSPPNLKTSKAGIDALLDRTSTRPLDGHIIGLHTDGQWMLNLQIHTGSEGGLRNAVLLELPVNGPIERRCVTFENMLAIISLVAKCWDLDTGEIASQHMFAYLPPVPSSPAKFRTHPQIGWLSYFSRRFGRLPDIDAELIPVRGRGNIVVTTRQKFSFSNPRHFAKWIELRRAFGLPTEPTKDED